MTGAFSSPALEEAVFLVGPAFVYQLFIDPRSLIEVRNLLRGLATQLIGNPLSPYVNLHVDASYKGGEWRLEANDKVFWSPGA